MSRRRRLALRQIEEPDLTVALSVAEDERDAQMHAEARVQEPNFSLLPGMMMNVGSTPDAPVVLIDSDEEMAEGHAPTQLVSSQSQQERVDVPPQKKPRRDSESGPNTRPQAPTVTERAGAEYPKGIFQLYQTGLCAEHTLRLHFIRQRPPPPPAKRVEDEFVLPRPCVTLSDMLPPTTISFSDLLTLADHSPDIPIATQSRDGIRDLDSILQSARDHWRQLSSVDDSKIVSWRFLQEQEWSQVFRASSGIIPPTEDIIRAMEVLRADSFAAFVWKELLPAIVQRIHSDGTHVSLQQFASTLLSHPHFRRLSAKDFRAQLRGHQLRAVDAAFGANAELELVTTFHKLRNSD